MVASSIASVSASLLMRCIRALITSAEKPETIIVSTQKLLFLMLSRVQCFMALILPVTQTLSRTCFPKSLDPYVYMLHVWVCKAQEEVDGCSCRHQKPAQWHTGNTGLSCMRWKIVQHIACRPSSSAECLCHSPGQAPVRFMLLPGVRGVARCQRGR